MPNLPCVMWLNGSSSKWALTARREDTVFFARKPGEPSSAIATGQPPCFFGVPRIWVQIPYRA